jgi:hypothetical protein
MPLFESMTSNGSSTPAQQVQQQLQHAQHAGVGKVMQDFASQIKPRLDQLQQRNMQLSGELNQRYIVFSDLNNCTRKNPENYNDCAGLITASRDLAIFYETNVPDICRQIQSIISEVNILITRIEASMGNSNDNPLCRLFTNPLLTACDSLREIQSSLCRYSNITTSALDRLAQIAANDEEYTSGLVSALQQKGPDVKQFWLEFSETYQQQHGIALSF